MKLYSYKFIVVALFMLSINYGCKKFVDLASPTVVRTDQYFNDQVSLTSAVNGMYSSLRDYYSDFYILAELPSDNAESNGANGAVSPIDQLAWEANNSDVSRNWLRSYSTIARANIILDRIDAVSMDEDIKVQYKGEAKFIRALIYFNLVQFFGNIPLVIHEIKTEEEAYAYPQVSMQDVYSQVEADLKDAIQALPDTYSGNEIGKATKGAAQTLLGKVYVTNKKFTEALPVLKAVINSGNYMLLPDYADVFDVKNKNNKEIIFDIQYLGNGYNEGSRFSAQFAPNGSYGDITTDGLAQGKNAGTLDLYNSFEDGDLRKGLAADLYVTASGVKEYYTRKFLDKPIATQEGNNNWPVLRYADALLLYAEALNESGSTDAEIDPLNEVRDRADLPPLSGLDQNALRLAIQHERRVELCFEGDRWLDLLRTGSMLATLEAYKVNYLTTGYQVGNYKVTQNKVLFPIPFDEISLNPELVQNPGYQ